MFQPVCYRGLSFGARSGPAVFAALAALWVALTPDAAASQTSGSGASATGPLIDSAYAALEGGDLRRAGRWADRALERAPRDPKALIARGRVYLEWPGVGRFRALDLFRRAAHHTPDDPEPHYWIGRTGLALLGSDGEAIARRGLERAIALDPGYRDAWERWGRLYRSPKERARLVEVLRPHTSELEIRARIIHLWLEDGQCLAVDSALAELERERPADPRWPAWRSECAFVQGRDAEGLTHYERAIGLAERDTLGVLWAQIASIARPDERAAFTAIPPADRARFYGVFWARRDPNVRTSENERIAEHFRRRAEARDRYILLHPLSRYHYSLDYRDYVSRVSRTERERYVAEQLDRGSQIAEALSSSAGLTLGEQLTVSLGVIEPLPALARVLALRAGGREPDLTGISPEILPLGRNLPEMIDDRGLVYIRHGPPERVDYRTLDAEVWAYDSEPPLGLRFARGDYPPDPPISDMIYRPMTASQAVSVIIAMTSDRSSLAAPLEFGFWFARFRDSDDPRRTELVVVPDATVSATAVLWDGAGLESGRGRAPAGTPIRVTSRPGRLMLAVDAERSDSLGRYRGVIEIPSFDVVELAVSDVLIGRAVHAGPPSRLDAIAAAARSLELPAAEPFSTYVEVYGLGAERGVHRYELTYEFKVRKGALARLIQGEDAVALGFERVVPTDGSGEVVEALRVSGGQVPPGEYSLTVRVRDVISGEERSSTAVSVRLLP